MCVCVWAAQIVGYVRDLDGCTDISNKGELFVVVGETGDILRSQGRFLNVHHTIATILSCH